MKIFYWKMNIQYNQKQLIWNYLLIVQNKSVSIHNEERNTSILSIKIKYNFNYL